MQTLVWRHIGELLTGQGFAVSGGRFPEEKEMGRIHDGAVAFEKNGRILWIGPDAELPKRFSQNSKTKAKNFKNRSVVTAGWVDCHTHLIFAGNRSHEFALRCQGVSYETIAKKGGGILFTVKQTREISDSELTKLTQARIKDAYELGVRCLEIKSGYGLDFESEIKILKILQKLKKSTKDMQIQVTYLGAHAIPEGQSREEYVSEIITKHLPLIAKQKLADACDIFVDEGYFTLEDAKNIFETAKKLGLKIKMHGDELANTESAAFAARQKCLSVDHLLKISPQGIVALSQSETVAVLLPITALYLKAPYAPARELIRAGVRVALATDFNPGSSMCNHLGVAMTLSALYMGMTSAEILAGVTYNAAKALGFEKELGTLEVGKRALMTVLPFDRFEESFYKLAWVPSQF